MAKYKIIVVGMLLANNTMAKGGDIVDGEQLNGDPKDLVKEGFVTPVKEKQTTDDKIVVTQEMLDKDPELAKTAKVGDKIDKPA